MLKEFALTPHVFDPAADPQDPRWREYIRMLIVSVFRVPTVPPVVFSGLHWSGGGDQCVWEQTTKALVDSIEDDEARRDAQALLTQVRKHLVRRSPIQDWPGDDEASWGQEAALAHRSDPLDRVIAQIIDNVPADAPRAPLSGVVTSDFWNVLHSRHEAPRPGDLPPAVETVADAVRPIRLILRHADALIFSMPYEPCEEFALECIREGCRRQHGMRAPLIVLHRKSSANPVAKSTWLTQQLAGTARQRNSTVTMWPDPYRERLVLGCRIADLGNGQSKLAVRWGVSMTHVWGEGDPANAEPMTYSLLSETQAKRHADQLESRAMKLRLVPFTL